MTVLVGSVLMSSSVPLQLPTVQPGAGSAVRPMRSPCWYSPAGQSATNMFSHQLVSVRKSPAPSTSTSPSLSTSAA